MEIKVALLLVSALIAVAAAYPTKDQQQAVAESCNNYNVLDLTIFGGYLRITLCTTICKHVWLSHHAS